MRVSCVTGAAQGLGAAIAQALVSRGDVVVMSDANEALNEETARRVDPSGEYAIAVTADVRRREDIERLVGESVERFGRLDVMVNNAALTHVRSFWEITTEEWDEVLAVNLRGAFHGCQIAGEHMRRRPGGGRIVNLASVAGQHGRSPTGAHYAASKGGTIALTRVAATELAPHGVTVNAIAPALIDGPAVAAVPPDRLEVMASAVPLGRIGRPEEVGDLVAFLTSEASGFITGATYDINGGLLMR